MKVILTCDIAGVGRKYDIKNVSDGYARNFLFPQKKAEVATEKAIKIVAEKRKSDDQEKGVQKNLLDKNLKELDGVKISISEKANEKGHLFAAVHKEEIVKFLKEQKQLDIAPEMMDLENPIKEVGEHKIKAGKAEFVLEVKAI